MEYRSSYMAVNGEENPHRQRGDWELLFNGKILRIPSTEHFNEN